MSGTERSPRPQSPTLRPCSSGPTQMVPAPATPRRPPSRRGPYRGRAAPGPGARRPARPALRRHHLDLAPRRGREPPPCRAGIGAAPPRARSTSASFSTTSRNTSCGWAPRPGGGGGGRDQPHPTGCRARPRHRLHRLPARRHRRGGRPSCSTASTSRSPPIASSASTATATGPGSVGGRSRPTRRGTRWRPTTSSCCSSRRAPRATPRRCAAPRAAWPPSPGGPPQGYGFEPDDVCYCPMPLFHGNAIMALWAPALAVGASVALAGRFSASRFLADVRHFGATRFTYVGKALAYVLATPERDDDGDNPLRQGFGTEASAPDRAIFERRFGCRLVEGYGSSEGGTSINVTPDTPPGSLGLPLPTDDVAVIDPDTGRECDRARFDAGGRARQRRRPPSARSSAASGARGLRGLLQEPRRRRRAGPQRLVLVRRPRISRRGRLLLLRGARRGLAARRLGELRRRPHRAGRRAPPRRRRRRGLRRARPPLR